MLYFNFVSFKKNNNNIYKKKATRDVSYKDPEAGNHIRLQRHTSNHKGCWCSVILDRKKVCGFEFDY